MGVLQWGYEQTLDTPMWAIERALNARHKHLSKVVQAVARIFGTVEDEAATPAPMTPDLFDTLFSSKR